MQVSTPPAPVPDAVPDAALDTVLDVAPVAEVFPAQCPSRTLLDHVVSKWGVLMLVSLSERPHRWSELRRRAEGISEKMLAQTLKTLESDGLVLREQAPVMPPRVDYSLTARGHEVAALLRPLLHWVGEHAEELLGES